MIFTATHPFNLCVRQQHKEINDGETIIRPGLWVRFEPHPKFPNFYIFDSKSMKNDKERERTESFLDDHPALRDFDPAQGWTGFTGCFFKGDVGDVIHKRVRDAEYVRFLGLEVKKGRVGLEGKEVKEFERLSAKYRKMSPSGAKGK